MTMGSGRSRHDGGRGGRWVGRAAVAVGVTCIVAGMFAPPVGANYGRIAAEARCDRNVSWTASASSEGTADERTNNEVSIEYREADSDDAWTAAGPAGAFLAADDFTFSGTFPLPPKVDEVELRVVPEVAWGAEEDGDPAGEPRFTTASLPSDCASQPIVASIVMDCEAGGASVTTRNVGGSQVAAALSVDRVVVRDIRLTPGASTTLLVPVLEGTTAAVRVNAGEFVVAQQEVDGDCDLRGPAATITERCGVRQAVVLARSDASSARPVEIRAADAIVHRAEVGPGEVLQRTIELPATGSVPVRVEVGGTLVASAEVGGCDGPVTGAVSCGTDGRPSCATAATAPPVEAPPPPPPPLTVEYPETTLATTGPWQRAIVLVLGGVLLAGGGAALVLEQRRRPRPSLLANVVAPYRQRWWDES